MAVSLIIAGSRGVDPSDETITAEVVRLPLEWGWDPGTGDPAPVSADKIPQAIREVVCGAADGADIAGQRWAISLGIPVHYERITTEDVRQWGKYMAPKMRNRRMAERGDVALCFWDGMSSGTPDLCMRMVMRGKHVVGVPAKRVRGRRKR